MMDAETALKVASNPALYIQCTKTREVAFALAAEVGRLQAVTHAQHAELLQLRKSVAQVREVCAMAGDYTNATAYVGDVLGALNEETQ